MARQCSGNFHWKRTQKFSLKQWALQYFTEVADSQRPQLSPRFKGGSLVWRHVWSHRHPFLPPPPWHCFTGWGSPLTIRAFMGAIMTKWKPVVSVEVLMTFRAAVESLGKMQTHTAWCVRKDKESHGSLAGLQQIYLSSSEFYHC